MKIVDKRFYISVAVLLAAGLGLSHFYGSVFQEANPRGLLLATLPSDHEGPIPYEPAYPFGFGFGLAAFAAGAIVLSSTFYISARIWRPNLVRLGAQLVVSSLLVSSVLFVLHILIEKSYSV